MIGDSILDNTYWNDVGEDGTGQVLKSLLVDSEKYNVKDRSTEELAAVTLLAHLNSKDDDSKITVRQHYIDARNSKDIPYQDYNNGYDIRKFRYIENDYVFISIGGNDLFLHGDTEIRDIIQKIIDIYNFSKIKS